MRSSRQRWAASLLAILLPLIVSPVFASQADVPASPAGVVQFQFSHPVAVVPAYTIVLRADGTGTYSEATGPAKPVEEASEARSADTSATGPAAAKPGASGLRVSPATLQRLFAARGSLGPKSCETKLKRIAQTGSKTLSYSAEGPPASCTFNYSDTPVLNEVAATFIALAETVQAGERLASKHRYDRLGLDLEMETLENEVKGGRALEVGNISPVLTSIVNDERVIERVRRRAARLLQDTQLPSEAASGKAEPGSSER